MEQALCQLALLSAALLAAVAHARVILDQQPLAGCSFVQNTYVTGSYLSRSTGVATQAACCSLCSTTAGCDLFSFCPANATDGCFTGGYNAYYEDAGACTLYSLAGAQPSVEQQGPDTLWITGVPPGKTLPKLPKFKPGACAPAANTMLAGTFISGTTAPSEEKCCSLCTNTPNCAAWTWCLAAQSDKCIILSGTQAGQTCNLYSLPDNAAAEVVQQGPETTWISSYRDPDSRPEIPDASTTAPAGCNVVQNVMLTSGDWLGGWYDVGDAQTCCTRCRNTPTCGVWAWCGGGDVSICATKYGSESTGSCLLYAIDTPNDIKPDQSDSHWVSGVKWAEDSRIGAAAAPAPAPAP